MRRRARIAIKRFICLAIFVKLLVLSGILDAIMSVANNLHESENFILDTFAEDSGKYVGGVQRKQRVVRQLKPPCGDMPKGLIGLVTLPEETPDLKMTELANPKMKEGSYEHSACQSRYRVAIIIPLRGREKNLRHMLSHMHPIWQRQELSYTVFIITQAGKHTFNKAKLMNAGFREARSYGQYDCFVFHDVDALLEDDRCLYWCDQQNPRHLCAHADVFNYKEVWYYSSCRLPQSLLTMTRLFGGVTMFTAEQFTRINGFSNYYWGWGGEDDDMYNRLINKGYQVVNPYGRQCSYTLLQHPHETLNAPTRAKESLVYHAASRQDKDGLHNVRYKVLSYQYKPLFINITVDVGKPSERMQEFIDNSKNLWFFNQCVVRMPWNL